MRIKFVKKACKLLVLCGICTLNAFQLQSQNSINSAGGDFSNSGSINYTIGQIVTIQLASSNGNAVQGVQIPLEQLVLSSGNALELSNNLLVYPNPTNSNLELKTELGLDTNTVYQLFNSQGLLVTSNTIDMSHTIIDMEELSVGVYYLKVNDQNNNTTTIKILKR